MIIAAAVHKNARREIVAPPLPKSAVHHVGVVARAIDQSAYREVDSRALAVLRHFVRVVAAAVPQESGAVPVSDALIVYVAQVAVVARVINKHRDTARVINVALAYRKSLAE